MFIIFLILLNTSLISLEWLESVQKAYHQASKEQKPIFIDVYADWCKYCKILQREIYPSPKIKKKLENDFVLLKINGERFPNFRKKFYIFAYPSIVILDKNGVFIQKITGASISSEYLLKKINKAYQEKDKEKDLLQKINTEPSNLTNYYRLSLYYEEAKKPRKAISTLENIDFVLFNDKEIKNKIYYRKCILLLENDFFKKSTNCFEKYIKIFQKNSTIDSYYYLGTLYFQSKKNALAKEYFTKYLKQVKNQQKRENIQNFIKDNL